MSRGKKKRLRKLYMRALGALIFLSVWAACAADAGASQTETDQVWDSAGNAMMQQFDYDGIDQSLKELFPEEKMDFRETVSALMKGDTKASWELLKKLAVDQLAYAFRVNKSNLVHILLIALIAAVFTNFSNAFQNKQISEISFYILYLLLIALCLDSFQAAVDWVGGGVEKLLSFMKVLGPVYFAAVAVAKGSVTSVAFYNLILLLIFLIELFILKFLLPAVHVYIMIRLLNHLSGEEYLSRFAELMETVIAWTLKTLLACVIGLNVVQGLIAPAVDSVKRSALTRGAEAIPGVGDAIGGVTEVVLAAAVLVKNSIGLAGMTVCAALCAGPLIQAAAMTLMYRLAAAVIQPVSDKRIVGCISGIGEGCQLLVRVVFTVGVLFFITIAVVAATAGRT